jgi:polyribonucleotide nucleotidyltransferase
MAGLQATPTMAHMDKRDLALVVAATEEAIVMIEAGARQVKEELILKGIELAHQKIREIIGLQKELQKLAGKPKGEAVIHLPSDVIRNWLFSKAEAPVAEIMRAAVREKQQEGLQKLTEELIKEIQSTSDEALKQASATPTQDVKALMEELEKKVVRQMIIQEQRMRNCWPY